MVQRLAALTEGLSFFLFAALLVWVPVPLGSNRFWSWSLAALALAALLLLAAPAVAAHGVRLPRRVLAAGLFYFAVLAWIWVQGMPAPAGLEHPAWHKLEAFGIEAVPRIALDPAAARDGLMRLMSYAGAFWLAFLLGQDARTARRLLLVVLLAGAFGALYALASHFIPLDTIVPGVPKLQYERLHGSFVNPNNFATYANLALVVACVLLAEPFLVNGPGPTWRRTVVDTVQRLLGPQVFLVVALVLLASATLLTGSRGGLVSLAVALLVLFVLLGLLARPGKGPLLLGLLVAGGAFAGLVLLSGDAVFERLARIDTDERADIWSVCLELIRARPWLGHGQGSFEAAFEMLRDERFPLRITKAHSTYIEQAVELGLPAAALMLASMLLLVSQCLRGVFTRRRDVIFPLAASTGAVLVGVHAIFDFGLQIPAIAITFAALLGLGCAQSVSSTQRRRGDPDGWEMAPV